MVRAGPRAELGWLARTRYLAPVDDLPVWSLPCFYVRRTHRGQRVMDALIEAAVPVAAAAGAPALEAYPVDTAVPGHTGNLFPGLASAFARHGFRVVARRKPDRPVMRHALTLIVLSVWYRSGLVVVTAKAIESIPGRLFPAALAACTPVPGFPSTHRRITMPYHAT